MDEFTDDIILACADFLDSVDLSSFARVCRRVGLQKDEFGLSLVDQTVMQKVSGTIANLEEWRFSDALRKRKSEGWPTVLNRLGSVQKWFHEMRALRLQGSLLLGGFHHKCVSQGWNSCPIRREKRACFQACKCVS